MGKRYITIIVPLILALVLFFGCQPGNEENVKIYDDKDELAIKTMHDTYVAAWLDNDEKTVMSLMEKGSRIQPSSLCPIEGEVKIREFWFPKDGSVTTINRFETEILSTHFQDSLGITTHNSMLDWSYQKDSIQMHVEQRGIATTVYRRQTDGGWKIWRQMWTDIYSKQK